MIALDASVIPVCLPSDEDKPAGVRPEFLARTKTKRQADAIRRKLAGLVAAPLPADGEPDALCAVLAECDLLAGWSNVRDRTGQLLAFDPQLPAVCIAQLEDVLTTREFYALPHLLLEAGGLTLADRKNSDSRSPGAATATASAPAAADPTSAA